MATAVEIAIKWDLKRQDKFGEKLEAAVAGTPGLTVRKLDATTWVLSGEALPGGCSSAALEAAMERIESLPGDVWHQASRGGAIQDVIYLYDEEEKKRLQHAALRPSPVDISKLFDYFGAEVALYFAFLSNLSVFLVVPSVFALLIYFFDTRIDDNVDSFQVFLYAIFMLLWSPALLRSFDRFCVRLTYDVPRTASPLRNLDYHGPKRNNPVTDQEEIHFSRWKRIPRYALSALVTGVFLLVAMGAMFACLNLDGYFGFDSPLHVALLNSRNRGQPGMVYSDDYTVVQFLPTIFHSLAIFVLNRVYSVVAEKLTEFENHKTLEDFHFSLICKRVPFEFFDCFLSLFYLMLWERNIASLRHELIGLFLTDIARRFAMEVVIPFSLYRTQKQVSVEKKASAGRGNGPAAGHLQRTIAKEMLKPEIDLFDEYIEVIMSFAYLTLFASVVPLASALCLVGIAVEKRADFFKLVYIHRRPRPVPAKTIGVWRAILQCVCYGSVVVNAIIFGYTSNQLETLFIGFSSASLLGGHAVNSLMGIVLFEHVMLAIQACIFYATPVVPGDIAIAIQRAKLGAKRDKWGLNKQSSSKTSRIFIHYTALEPWQTNNCTLKLTLPISQNSMPASSNINLMAVRATLSRQELHDLPGDPITWGCDEETWR